MEGIRGGFGSRGRACSLEVRLFTSFLPKEVLRVGTKPSLLEVLLRKLKLRPRDGEREESVVEARSRGLREDWKESSRGCDIVWAMCETATGQVFHVSSSRSSALSAFPQSIIDAPAFRCNVSLSLSRPIRVPKGLYGRLPGLVPQ